MSYGRCTARFCGGTLTERHDRTLGRVAIVCAQCERKAARLCRDCPKQLPGKKAIRCPECAKAHERKRDRESHRNTYRDPVRRKKLLARRRKANARPAFRAKRAAESRAYRAAHAASPPTALDRLYKRERSRHRYATDEQYRERQKAKARNRQHRRSAREAERKAASGEYRAVVVHGTKTDPNAVFTRYLRIRPKAAPRALQFTGFANRDAEILLEAALRDHNEATDKRSFLAARRAS